MFIAPYLSNTKVMLYSLPEKWSFPNFLESLADNRDNKIFLMAMSKDVCTQISRHVATQTNPSKGLKSVLRATISYAFIDTMRNYREIKILFNQLVVFSLQNHLILLDTYIICEHVRQGIDPWLPNNQLPKTNGWFSRDHLKLMINLQYRK